MEIESLLYKISNNVEATVALWGGVLGYSDLVNKSLDSLEAMNDELDCYLATDETACPEVKWYDFSRTE